MPPTSLPAALGPARSTGLSLSYQLERLLRDRILSGAYPAGTRLPPELELARQHGVSVITAQRALRVLESEHLISRTRGRGTFVLETPVHLRAPKVPGSLDMIFAADLGADALVLSMGMVPTPARFIEHFGGRQDCFELRRVLVREGVPVHYSINYFKVDRPPRLRVKAQRRYPMARLLHEELGVQVTRVTTYLQARPSHSDVAHHLQTDLATPLFWMDTLFHDDLDVVAANEIYFRADRFVLRVEHEPPAGWLG